MLNIIVLCLWIVFLTYWAFSLSGNKRTNYRQRTFVSGVTARGILLVIIIVLWLIPFFSKPIFIPTTLIQIIGFVLCLSGLVFAFWARSVLGANWSPYTEIKTAHELITRGPYKLVRHPIYSGVILALLGSIIVNGRLRVAILFALIAFGMVIRAKIEEQLMIKEFGDQYLQYKKHTKMLIPGIF